MLLMQYTLRGENMSKQNEIRLTQEQYDKLLKRKQELIEEEIPQNALDIEKAKEYGDLSENAEYDAAKDAQGKLHAELKMVEDRLARASIIKQNDRFDIVQVGHKVTVENQESNEVETFVLIGQDGDGISEIDIASKLGNAVLDKQVGELFSYEANDPSLGILTFKVLNIE